MKFCPSCGAALAGATRFCANCGAPLAVAPKPPAAAPVARPPAAPPTVPMPAQPSPATPPPTARVAAAVPSPSAGLPPLRPAKRQTNWPALIVGLLALALIAGGLSFLVFRDEPAGPTPSPTTTVAAASPSTTLQP